MYGYVYSENKELNKLLMDYTSEFDVVYIGYSNGKHTFMEFGKTYSITEKRMRADLRKHLKECGKLN